MKTILFLALIQNCSTTPQMAAERGLLTALTSPEKSVTEVRQMLDSIPLEVEFYFFEEWAAIYQDIGLDSWRRVVAAEVLLSRFMDSYDVWQSFKANAEKILRLPAGSWSDMSMAQSVPFETRNQSRIMMGLLTIPADAGMVALYVKVNVDSNKVEQWAFFPE